MCLHLKVRFAWRIACRKKLEAENFDSGIDRNKSNDPRESAILGDSRRLEERANILPLAACFRRPRNGSVTRSFLRGIFHAVNCKSFLASRTRLNRSFLFQIPALSLHPSGPTPGVSFPSDKKRSQIKSNDSIIARARIDAAIRQRLFTFDLVKRSVFISELDRTIFSALVR